MKKLFALAFTITLGLPCYGQKNYSGTSKSARKARLLKYLKSLPLEERKNVLRKIKERRKGSKDLQNKFLKEPVLKKDNNYNVKELGDVNTGKVPVEDDTYWEENVEKDVDPYNDSIFFLPPGADERVFKKRPEKVLKTSKDHLLRDIEYNFSIGLKAWQEEVNFSQTGGATKLFTSINKGASAGIGIDFPLWYYFWLGLDAQFFYGIGELGSQERYQNYYKKNNSIVGGGVGASLVYSPIESRGAFGLHLAADYRKADYGAPTGYNIELSNGFLTYPQLEGRWSFEENGFLSSKIGKQVWSLHYHFNL